MIFWCPFRLLSVKVIQVILIQQRLRSRPTGLFFLFFYLLSDDRCTLLYFKWVIRFSCVILACSTSSLNVTETFLTNSMLLIFLRDSLILLQGRHFLSLLFENKPHVRKAPTALLCHDSCVQPVASSPNQQLCMLSTVVRVRLRWPLPSVNVILFAYIDDRQLHTNVSNRAPDIIIL